MSTTLDMNKDFIFFRLVLQCIAVFKYKSHLLSSPAVPCVDRKKVKYVSPDIVQPPEGKGAAYVGKRTGKVIRSLYAGEELYTQASQHTCGKTTLPLDLKFICTNTSLFWRFCVLGHRLFMLQ